MTIQQPRSRAYLNFRYKGCILLPYLITEGVLPLLDVANVPKDMYLILGQVYQTGGSRCNAQFYSGHPITILMYRFISHYKRINKTVTKFIKGGGIWNDDKD